MFVKYDQFFYNQNQQLQRTKTNKTLTIIHQEEAMITFNTSSFSNPVNENDFGIPAPVLNAILTPYFVISIVLGLLGNTIVIKSTFVVDVWKFDESLITLLRYLAVTDAGLTLFHILPQFISLAVDSWVLGKAGVVIAFVRYPLFMMEMSVTLALSVVKLHIIRNPFNCNSQETLLAIKIIFSMLFLFFLVIDFSKIMRCYVNDSISCSSYYKPSLLRCSFKTDDRFGGLLKIGYGLIVMGLLVLTNLAILFKIWKARRTTNTQNDGMKSFAVVSMVCWVFIISYLPFLLISSHLSIHPESEVVKFASEQFVNLSIVANPIIYTILYKSFFEHVVKSFGFRKIRKKGPRNGGRETKLTTASDDDL